MTYDKSTPISDKMDVCFSLQYNLRSREKHHFSDFLSFTKMKRGSRVFRVAGSRLLRCFPALGSPNRLLAC